MNVKRLIAIVFAAGGLLAMTSPTLAAEDGAKPNIVVIMGQLPVRTG